MKPSLLSWIEVDLSAIANNVRALKRHVGQEVTLGAVVKANAYGLGAVEVAETSWENGADWVIVNRSIEGVELRRAGIQAPLLVLGHTLPQEADRMVRWDLRPTVTNLPQAEALSRAAVYHSKEVPVHIKIDTGLGRLGVFPADTLKFVQHVATLPGLIVEGAYSHPSVADETAEDDVTYTHMQFERLISVRTELEQARIEIPIWHFCNSGGTIRYPEMHLNLVRCGTAIDGFDPFIGQEGEGLLDLQPVVSLKSHLVRVETQPANSAISYGRTYVTPAPTKIAVVPVGYGDGYRRALSNKGYVLVRGQRAPIVGRVCMDQFMIDVSHIPGVDLYDEVVLIGSQDDERIISEDLANLIETHVNEVTTALASRVPRIYLKNQQVIKIKGLTEEDSLYY